MNPLLTEPIRERVRDRVISYAISTLQTELEEYIESATQTFVDLILGTMMSVPRIETEGPLTFGKPTGQPLSEIGDILTPSLFNYIATQTYDYVWLGAGGVITTSAIVLYVIFLTLSSEYEMLQMNTSKKKEKNHLVGGLLIVFWFPLYLLIINLSHGTIHAVVDVDHLIETIGSIIITSITAFTAVIGGGAIGGAALGPLGALIPIVALILLIIVGIVIILPYFLLSLFMFLRTIIMGVFAFFSPFLIAGSYSGLPNISEVCDKILWKSIVIAVIPVVMAPFLYFADMVFFPLFEGRNWAAESVGAIIGPLFAFAIMGYVLLAALWIGFSKISPASQRAGQSVFRGAIAAGMVGIGSRLGMEGSQLGKAAEMTIRVGPTRGVSMVTGGVLANAYFGSQESGSNDYEQEYDNHDEREGHRGDNGGSGGGGSGGGGSGGGGSGGGYEQGYGNNDAVLFDSQAYTLEDLQQNLILNPEGWVDGKWGVAPDVSSVRIEQIVDRAYENGVSGKELDRKFEQIVGEDGSERYLAPAKAAAVDRFSEKYPTTVRPQNHEYNLIGIDDDQVDLTIDIDDTVDPLDNNGRVIYDPVAHTLNEIDADIDRDQVMVWSSGGGQSSNQTTTDTQSYDSSDSYPNEYEDTTDPSDQRDRDSERAEQNSVETQTDEFGEEYDSEHSLEEDTNEQEVVVETEDDAESESEDVDEDEDVDVDVDVDVDEDEDETPSHLDLPPDDFADEDEDTLEEGTNEQSEVGENQPSDESTKESVKDEYQREKEALSEYLRTHEDATAMDAVTNRGVDPTEWVGPVQEALDTGEPLQTPNEYEDTTDPSDQRDRDGERVEQNSVEAQTDEFGEEYDNEHSLEEDTNERREVSENQSSKSGDDSNVSDDISETEYEEQINKADKDAGDTQSVGKKEQPDQLQELSQHRQKEYRSIQNAIQEELNAHPDGDISPVRVCGAAGAEPVVWVDPIDKALESEHPVNNIPIPKEID